jgi:S1-C subfamily serine protease
VNFKHSILTSRADVEGISFAIPMHEAMPIVKYMKEGKNFTRPVIGAKMVSLTDKTRNQLSQLHMFHPDQKGVLITFVKESSPAHQAGIVSGDIISQIDGQVVGTVHDVLRKIGRRTNQEIKMTIIRNIPFEQDWYGRTFTFFTQVKEVCIKTSVVE